MTRRTCQYLTFSLDHHLFAIPANTVREINQISKLTIGNLNSPNADLALRDAIIPLVDFRSKLGLESRAGNDEISVVVIDCPEQRMGIQVDSVHSVIDLPSLQWEDPVPDQEPVFFERILIQGHSLILVNILLCLDKKHLNANVANAFRGVATPKDIRVS